MGECSGEKVMVLCDVVELWGGVWPCVFVELEWSIEFEEEEGRLEEVDGDLVVLSSVSFSFWG